MNKPFVHACIALALIASAGAAQAKGCITGAAVGGVAGHVAGHHGVIGAVARCAINHHRNTVKDRQAAAAAQVSAQAPPPLATPSPR